MQLTVSFHIGDKQIDKLTEEQSSRMVEKLSAVMSRYYSVHLAEYNNIKESE